MEQCYTLKYLNIFLAVGIQLCSADVPDNLIEQMLHRLCIIPIRSPMSLTSGRYLKSAEEKS